MSISKTSRNVYKNKKNIGKDTPKENNLNDDEC